MKPTRPTSYRVARGLALCTVACWAAVGVLLIAAGIAARGPVLVWLGALAAGAAGMVLATVRGE
jgi:hypothetical protein